jgi:hypothetical protein
VLDLIGFVCGVKGSGKTKRMVGMANAIVDDALGKVVFVDDDTDRMFDLKHIIRLVAANDYTLENQDSVYGFIAGLVAGDFDIHTVFIDSFLRIINVDVEELIPMFEKLESMSDKHKVRVIISLSGEEADMPEYVQKKVMK